MEQILFLLSSIKGYRHLNFLTIEILVIKWNSSNQNFLKKRKNFLMKKCF